MSNDEIEERLRDLQPAAPRPSLRAEILDAVQAELDDGSGSRRLDRWLARPTAWGAAAALLMALFAGRVLLDRAHADRVAAFVRSDEAVILAARESRLTDVEDRMVATIGEKNRPLVRSRLRAFATRGVGERAWAARHAWLREWMKGEQR